MPSPLPSCDPWERGCGPAPPSPPMILTDGALGTPPPGRWEREFECSPLLCDPWERGCPPPPGSLGSLCVPTPATIGDEDMCLPRPHLSPWGWSSGTLGDEGLCALCPPSP